MGKNDLMKKGKEVRDKMKSEKIEKIIEDYRKYKLAPAERIDAMKAEMMEWTEGQLSIAEDLVSKTVEAQDLKNKLHEAKVELQNERSQEATSSHEKEFYNVKTTTDDNSLPLDKGVVKECKEKHQKDNAESLAKEMVRVGMLSDDKLESQVNEMLTWNNEMMTKTWEMVDKAVAQLNDKALEHAGTTSPKVEGRKWGPGSEVSRLNQERLHKHKPGLYDRLKTEEKQVVIDKPSNRKTIKQIAEEDQEQRKSPKPLSGSSYVNRGSIKDRKKDLDKTTDEPEFFKLLRDAREVLDKYDDTHAKAKVEALKAKEAMLHEERQYDGSKLHTDNSKIFELTKNHSKSKRELFVIEKVYAQALKDFEKEDVYQVSAEELKKAVENYQVERTIETELDVLFGGPYRSGDDNYYKWLTRKRKSWATGKAVKQLNKLVGQIDKDNNPLDEELKRTSSDINTVASFNRE